MSPFAIGSPSGSTPAGNIIQSIRDQIPDPVSDPALDGNGFSLATLLRWMNDAMRVIAVSAPVVQDWYAVQSTQNMDLYALPATILSVERLWYDLEECFRSTEGDNLGRTKITARSFFFGPHSLGAAPVLSVEPACTRTGATTTLAGPIAATDTSFAVANLSAMNAYGYLQIENEILTYRQVTSSTNTVSAILRGQAGTTATQHASGTTVTELNLFFKVSRLPTPITGPADAVEIPIALTPLIELYVLGKVRESEQEFQQSLAMMREFTQAVERLANKPLLRGLRQGLQVRTEVPGPYLYFGRVVVP